jgi:hypothetical protein
MINDRMGTEWELKMLPLRIAGLNVNEFMFSDYCNEPEDIVKRIYRYYHCPSGQHLFMNLRGQFFEWQDDVYNGPPLYPAMGGIVMPGAKCKKLVEIDRARALARLHNS